MISYHETNSYSDAHTGNQSCTNNQRVDPTYSSHSKDEFEVAGDELFFFNFQDTIEGFVA